MTTQYAFVDETDGLHSAVLVEEGVIWKQHSSGEHSIDYENSPDITLTEAGNETYMTANEDENDTQYFSVLETSDDVILAENIDQSKICADTTTNLLLNEESDENTVDIAGQQVVLFKVGDGDTEELYGIQLAQDEEGNIQKYQFKIRHNEEGNLEAVPETIQILPLDSEVPIITSHEEGLNDESEDANETTVNEQIFIKQELTADAEDNVEPEPEEEDEEGEESEQHYTDALQYYQHENIEHFSESADINEYQNVDLKHRGEDGLQHENLKQFQDEGHTESYTYEEDLSEPMESKQGIIEEYHMSRKHSFKTEVGHSDSQTIFTNYICSTNEKTNKPDSRLLTNEESNQSDIDPDDQEMLPESNPTEEMVTSAQYEQLFIKENHIISTSDNLEAEHIQPAVSLEHIFAENEETTEESHHSDFIQGSINENESDNDDYQIVEGVHVTGDVEETFTSFDNINQIHYREPRKTLPLQTHVLKLQQQKHPNNRFVKTIIKNVKIKKVINSGDSKLKDGTYFVTKNQEKENLEEVRSVNAALAKATNPRSLLKTSHPVFMENKEVKSEEKFEKRFAKSKEAIQARQFHNFIAQTKIIHAPVRSERLPRKQTIKPVIRNDEEIIVQEVVVSSNGYIETSEDGVVKERIPLKPTEYIQLTDSDDDYDPKKLIKRKKKNKKNKSIVEITISDTEEDANSDAEIINLDSDNSESLHQNITKKRKGRRSKENPEIDTKNVESSDEKESQQGETSEIKSRKRGRRTKLSKLQGENSVDAATQDGNKEGGKEETCVKKEIMDLDKKLEIQCQKCTKTFPSQGSLKTHMQFHTFKEANKKHLKLNQTTKSLEPQKTGYKYKCTRCDQSFKNNLLLTRHLTNHTESSVLCNICKKKFSDQNELTTHKKTHFKSQICKSTRVQKVTPMKIKSRYSSMGYTKSPKKTNSFKCADCHIVFKSQVQLDFHSIKHRRFSCGTCGSRFLSKFVLDEHIRMKCVKSPKPKISMTQRKRLFSPKASIRKSTVAIKDKTKTQNTLIKCDKCTMTFATQINLTRHKVIKHGLSTPDKKILNKKTPTKHSHGGVPASEKIRNAFAALKRKLDK